MEGSHRRTGDYFGSQALAQQLRKAPEKCQALPGNACSNPHSAEQENPQVS